MINNISRQEQHLLDFLKAAKKIFCKYNIEFWLEGGTLLGAVRDGKFIPWEHDVDLAMWEDQIIGKKFLLAKDFCNDGFKVAIYEDYMHIYKTEEFWLDLNFYKDKGEHAVYPVLYPRNFIGSYIFILSSMMISPSPSHVRTIKDLKSFIRKTIICTSVAIIHILPDTLKRKLGKLLLQLSRNKLISYDIPRIAPSKYFKNLQSIEFYNIEFKTPSTYREYLAYKYGNDWNNPKKEWVAERDDLMVTKFQHNNK